MLTQPVEGRWGCTRRFYTSLAQRQRRWASDEQNIGQERMAEETTGAGLPFS